MTETGRHRDDRLTAEGMDRIGPFHPYLVFAAVLVFNVVLAMAIVTLIAAFGDWVEDLLWPGGPEWLPF